jgi:hypothetical protein
VTKIGEQGATLAVSSKNSMLRATSSVYKYIVTYPGGGGSVTKKTWDLG